MLIPQALFQCAPLCRMSKSALASVLISLAGLALFIFGPVVSDAAAGRVTSLGRRVSEDEQPHLKVSFRIQRGRLAVDRDHSTFTPTPSFIAASKIKEPEKLKRMLLDDLDAVLSKKAPFYWYAFNQNTISANYTEEGDKVVCKEGGTPLERVRACSTTWQDYRTNIYQTWTMTNAAADGTLPDNFKIGVVFSKFIWAFERNAQQTTISVEGNIKVGNASFDERLNIKMDGNKVVGVQLLFGVAF